MFDHIGDTPAQAKLGQCLTQTSPENGMARANAGGRMAVAIPMTLLRA
jgi:hypothetical protein